MPAHSFDDDFLPRVGKGERQAIILAIALHADLLLMDDREGVRAALNKGLDTTGTIGILNLDVKRSLLDLADAFARLRRTSLRYPEDLMQKLLALYQK
jgi:predicted nucleic acid-binding protein